MLSKFFESKAWEWMGKVIDIIILGLYWCLCSIPIFTIGASTTALYYSIHKVIFQGRGYTSEFFHSFKDNFKQATLSWLIFLLIYGVCGIDIYITRQMLANGDTFGSMWLLFVILMVLATVWAVYLFIYMARFENGFKETFKISGALAVIHFGYSIAVLLITAFFILFAYLMPVFILIIPELYILCLHPIFEKMFRPYMSEEDQKLEEERLQLNNKDR